MLVFIFKTAHAYSCNQRNCKIRPKFLNSNSQGIRLNFLYPRNQLELLIKFWNFFHKKWTAQKSYWGPQPRNSAGIQLSTHSGPAGYFDFFLFQFTSLVLVSKQLPMKGARQFNPNVRALLIENHFENLWRSYSRGVRFNGSRNHAGFQIEN